MWPALRKLALRLNRPLRVLDLATGSGDVPLALHRRAEKEHLRMTFAGCDLSAVAIDVAKSSAGPVDFFTLDLLNGPLPIGYDAFTCSLFLHHLDEPDVVGLLRKMREAKPRLILVNDLERSGLNYAAVWVASRLFSRSRVVHVDGPLSIRGAFTLNEMQTMADAAGLSGATVRASFPCRMLLEWRGEM